MQSGQIPVNGRDKMFYKHIFFKKGKKKKFEANSSISHFLLIARNESA